MAAHPPSAAAAGKDGSVSLPDAPGGHRGVSPRLRMPGGGHRGGPPTPYAGGAPNTPAGEFQIPWTPIIGFQGPSLVGFETPLMAFVVDVVTAGNFLPCAGPLHPRLARSLREIAGNPGGLVGPPPPSATSPGRRVALSSTIFKHCTKACSWCRPSFCLDYMASEDGGGAAGKPVPARTCPGYGFRRAVRTRGSGRRCLAYPSGRPANSQFGSQKGNALANWSAGARRGGRSDVAGDHRAPRFGQFTNQPVRLDRIDEPRLGPASFYAAAHRALAHPLSGLVEQGQLAARLRPPAHQPTELRRGWLFAPATLLPAGGGCIVPLCHGSTEPPRSDDSGPRVL